MNMSGVTSISSTNSPADSFAGALMMNFTAPWSQVRFRHEQTHGNFAVSGWGTETNTARIAHFFAYSPLAGWTASHESSLERRLWCSYLIDCVSDEGLNLLLQKIAEVCSRCPGASLLNEADADEMFRPPISSKAAQVLASIVHSRVSPAHLYFDEGEL
jgi:hypothetical protein